MKKILSLILNWLKTHKLLIGIILGAILASNFMVRPRVKAYLEGPAAKYETDEVRKESLVKTISASGEISAQNQVTLKFQTSGKLVWVGVIEGDYVKKWQAIASLDKEELKQTLKKELNDYLNERWNFEQDRDDYDISSDNLNQYTITDEVRRILEKAQFDLNNKIIDVEIADLAIRLATITSPIEGIVTNIDAPVAGVNITPATAEFTVADPTQMKFIANVDEADIAQIRVGQKTLINLDAYPNEEFEGRVDKIAFASVSTSGGGTAFPIDIYLPENFDQRFKVGMNGDTEIVLSSLKDILTVPADAIFRKDGQAYVKLIENKRVVEKKVIVGLENDTKVQITEGLKEGDTVIIGEKQKK